MRLVLPAVPHSVGEARHAVAALAEEMDLLESVVDDLRTIVTEACANVVLHAYPDVEGSFVVTALAGQGEFSVVVRDFGIGMGPRPMGDRESLRLGLALISTLCESHEVLRHPGGGTELRMVVSLAG